MTTASSLRRPLRLTLPLILAAISFSNWAHPASTEARRSELVRVGVVTLSYAPEDRTLAYVLEMLEQAAAQKAQIVCLPQECVPTDGGPQADAALQAIAAKAKAKRMYVVANLKENEGARTAGETKGVAKPGSAAPSSACVYLTSYLIDPKGKVVGKSRKTHQLPEESILLGDELPVFDTPHGKIGLMIGTDHYWPEIPLVLALKGAELILWSNGVEPVPQGYPLDIKMRVRAMDNHVTIAGAQYAGPLPYMPPRLPRWPGEPLGRGYVVDRSGIIVADTGHHTGVAVAAIDLKRGKDIFHLTYESDRTLFRALVDKNVAPVSFDRKGAKRRITVSVAQVNGYGPSPNPRSPFARLLDRAGSRNPDLIVMTEFHNDTDDDEGRAILALVAEKARQYKCHIYMAGLRDPQNPYRPDARASYAYLWDRSGTVIGKYRISQYGKSTELPVFKTDFGVVGMLICGDIYSQEMARALALQGAEIILCGSQSWGPSGEYNLWMQQTRAIDNGLYMAAVHTPSSDISQRSYIVDSCGYPLVATEYDRDGVATAEVDLDAELPWFTESEKHGYLGQSGYLPQYYSKLLREKKTGFRAVLFAQRRPELYGPIVEKSLAHRRISPEIWDKMNSPARPQ